MTIPLPDYTDLVDTAVGAYRDVRRSQAERSQAQEGVLNPGLRAEVTGGRHFDALHALLVRVFIDAGIPAHLVDVKKRPVAGYFRRSKSWDVVVMVADRVAGIIELKSMGPNDPGKTFNKRTDEALGQALDVAAIHGRCLQFMATNPDLDWATPIYSSADHGKPVDL